MTTLLSPRAPEQPTAPLPATSRLVAGALVVGVATDAAVRAGGATLAAALVIVVAAAVLLRAGVLVNRSGRLLVVAAPVFGACVAVRTSPWLVPLDLLAAVGLLAVGASLARSGSLAQLPARSIVVRALHGAAHVVRAPALLRRAEGTPSWSSGKVGAALQGAALAVPVVVVLGALLASADAVFASFVDVDLGVAEGVGHVIAIAAGGWGALGLLRVAAAPEPEDVLPKGPRLGALQATMLLLAVLALFASFVATSVVAALGGADEVLRTAGLTRAEYARSGFFQLLWVAGLTVAGLLGLSAATDLEGPDGRRLRRLCAGVAVLALPIVAVAVVRLDLYRDAYGWTMLRLTCTVVAVWLGIVLGLLALSIAGPLPLRHRGWFVPAAAATGLVLLLVVNVVNPEALVARHNLTRAASAPVDPVYLAELSDDAVPTIVSLLPTLHPATADAVAAAIGCPEPDGGGWAGWNLAERRAAGAREALCEA